MASIEAIIMALADHVTTTHHLDRGTVTDHASHTMTIIVRSLSTVVSVHLTVQDFFPLGTNKSTECTNAA